MPLLFLLRHAKSDWGSPALADRDRPLAGRGRTAAAAMARYLHAQHIHPDLALCSPARRTRETLDIIAPSLGDGVQTAFEEDLYGADADELLARLRALPAAIGSAIVVGHNPGIHELALLLIGETGETGKTGEVGGGSPAQRLAEKYPTGTLAILQAPGGWGDLGAAPATIVAFVTPKDL